MRTVSSQEKEYTLEKAKPRARLFLRNRVKGKYTHKYPESPCLSLLDWKVREHAR